MIIEDLAYTIVVTNFDAFDKGTIEQAKHRLIDITGCLIGGVNAPAARS